MFVFLGEFNSSFLGGKRCEHLRKFNKLIWVVVSNIFYFHPYLGKIPSHFDEHIFQRGGSTTNQKLMGEIDTNL